MLLFFSWFSGSWDRLTGRTKRRAAQRHVLLPLSAAASSKSLLWQLFMRSLKCLHAHALPCSIYLSCQLDPAVYLFNLPLTWMDTHTPPHPSFLSLLHFKGTLPTRSILQMDVQTKNKNVFETFNVDFVSLNLQLVIMSVQVYSWSVIIELYFYNTTLFNDRLRCNKYI